MNLGEDVRFPEIPPSRETTTSPFFYARQVPLLPRWLVQLLVLARRCLPYLCAGAEAINSTPMRGTVGHRLMGLLVSMADMVIAGLLPIDQHKCNNDGP